jgi:MFS family permease
MLDGFDILALSLVSPTLSREWHLTPQTLGLLFSAGLLGTAVGGFALSPIADLCGRRGAIMLNLVLMSVGMTFAGMARSVDMLAAPRFCTGLGVGAMSGCVGTLAFEYSPLKMRTLSLGLVVIGFTLGSLLGGYIAPPLLAQFSWRGTFVFGGACSLVLLVVVYFVLPESLDILGKRQGPRAFGAATKNLPLAQAASALMGFGIFGAAVALYGTGATAFSGPRARDRHGHRDERRPHRIDLRTLCRRRAIGRALQPARGMRHPRRPGAAVGLRRRESAGCCFGNLM